MFSMCNAEIDYYEVEKRNCEKNDFVIKNTGVYVIRHMLCFVKSHIMHMLCVIDWLKCVIVMLVLQLVFAAPGIAGK